jgi:hypothetical protein
METVDMQIHLNIGSDRFSGRLETQAAPRTVEYLLKLLPLELPLIHARWSGESLWAPFTNSEALPLENCARYPRPGQVLIYGGGISEPEILVPYGPTAFASKAGALAGNHVITLIDADAKLAAIGQQVLWSGSRQLSVALA